MELYIRLQVQTIAAALALGAAEEALRQAGLEPELVLAPRDEMGAPVFL